MGDDGDLDLAKELNADLLIIDESIPRVIAESIGLRVIGSLAIIYIAKKRGLIKENFDEIAGELRAKGVRFSDEVVNRLYAYGNLDEIRRPWNDPMIKIINGKKDDSRCGIPWDWFYPPHK